MSKSPVYQIPRNHSVTLGALIGSLYDGIRRSVLRFTAVNELENLSDQQLRDIGVDRNQIEQVAAREIAKLYAK
ncbi:MAG: DUF1127 domain-containing protein [Pseudomonadota bacterium]